MLSLQEAKELLDDESLTDEEVTKIRDAFQTLGEIIFDQWFASKK